MKKKSKNLLLIIFITLVFLTVAFLLIRFVFFKDLFSTVYYSSSGGSSQTYIDDVEKIFTTTSEIIF